MQITSDGEDELTPEIYIPSTNKTCNLARSTCQEICGTACLDHAKMRIRSAPPLLYSESKKGHMKDKDWYRVSAFSKGSKGPMRVLTLFNFRNRWCSIQYSCTVQYGTVPYSCQAQVPKHPGVFPKGSKCAVRVYTLFNFLTRWCRIQYRSYWDDISVLPQHHPSIISVGHYWDNISVLPQHHLSIISVVPCVFPKGLKCAVRVYTLFNFRNRWGRIQ